MKAHSANYLPQVFPKGRISPITDRIFRRCLYVPGRVARQSDRQPAAINNAMPADLPSRRQIELSLVVKTSTFKQCTG
jgi:hypothetical protein